MRIFATTLNLKKGGLSRLNNNVVELEYDGQVSVAAWSREGRASDEAERCGRQGTSGGYPRVSI